MLEEEKKFLEAIEDASIEQKHALIHAIEFAKKAHDGQLRKSGDPYVIHVIDVARVLWEKFHDLDLAIGGMLHDTVEDVEEISMGDIYREFGEQVGFIVDAASKDEKSFHLYPDVHIEDKVERQLWAGMKDVRTVLVKLADRDHNLSTLQHLQANKQIRIAFETQAIYQPLKEILNYEKTNNIQQITRAFNAFIEKKKIKDAHEMKLKLFNTYFNNIGDDFYDSLYNHNGNVIWEVNDEEMYIKLVTSENFSKNACTNFLWTDGINFKAHFYFIKGHLIQDNQGKLNIHTFKNN